MTPKQEKFCLLYVELGNASDAYRGAYCADKMKPETVNNKAYALLQKGEITARVEELQAAHRERHKITVDDLLSELEEARKLAMNTEKAAPAVSAVMGKARLLGLDKQILEHTGKDGGAIVMTDTEAAGRIAGIVAAAKARMGKDDAE